MYFKEFNIFVAINVIQSDLSRQWWSY